MKASKISKKIVKALQSTGPNYPADIPMDELDPMIVFYLASNGTI